MNDAATRAPGRPKDPEKRAAILDAAAALFLEHGFDRTTMDAIAAKAGVSKLTVYSHFADKEGLFRALIACKCDQYFEGKDLEHLAGLAPGDALTRLGKGFVGLMFNPDVLALYRILMAGAMQDPKLNRTFYETGPAPTIEAVARLLRHYDAAGLLEVAKPEMAADHLLSMLQGCPHWRALLNIEPEPSARQVKEHVKDCVAAFLRAYAPRKSSR